MSRGRFYTADELRQARRLKDHGVTWQQIANVLERPEDSLKRAERRYRQGIWAPGRQVEISTYREAAIEDLVKHGKTRLVDIAEHLGISKRNAHRRAMRMGLDAEMRRQIAAEGRTR